MDPAKNLFENRNVLFYQISINCIYIFSTSKYVRNCPDSSCVQKATEEVCPRVALCHVSLV